MTSSKDEERKEKYTGTDRWGCKLVARAGNLGGCTIVCCDLLRWQQHTRSFNDTSRRAKTAENSITEPIVWCVSGRFVVVEVVAQL
jgi:hypothetical protein